MARGLSDRRRCNECREWYEADPRAGVRQRVCSEGCRKARRGRQQKQRRKGALKKHQESERNRQRESRKRRRTTAAEKAFSCSEIEKRSVAGPVPPRFSPMESARPKEVSRAEKAPVSRAGIALQPHEIIDKIRQFLRQMEEPVTRREGVAKGRNRRGKGSFSGTSETETGWLSRAE